MKVRANKPAPFLLVKCLSESVMRPCQTFECFWKSQYNNNRKRGREPSTAINSIGEKD